MSNSLSLAHYFVEQGTGLHIPPDTTPIQWHQLANFLGDLEQKTTWWWADLIKFAKDHYGWDYDIILSALEQVGKMLAHNSAKQYVSVAKRFPSEFRTWDVQIVQLGHYAVVASMSDDQATVLLNQVEAEKMTTDELKRLTRAVRNAPNWSKATLYVSQSVGTVWVPFIAADDPIRAWLRTYMLLKPKLIEKLEGKNIQAEIKFYEVTE